MHGVHDPVDAGITANSLVLRIDEDDLVILVCRVLVDPVRVEDSQVGAATTDAGLGSGAKRALVFQVVDTLVRRLACTITLAGHLLIPSFEVLCIP